jgi:hypothetical protein
MSRLGPHCLGDFSHSGQISQLRASWLLIPCCLEKVPGLPDIDQSHCDTTGAFRDGFRQSFIPLFEPRHSFVLKTRTQLTELSHDLVRVPVDRDHGFHLKAISQSSVRRSWIPLEGDHPIR